MTGLTVVQIMPWYTDTVDVHDLQELEKIEQALGLSAADLMLPPAPRRYIHARIGAVCRERGISARQLADMTGWHVDRARWLMADVMDEIDLGELAALCTALSVQPADLLVVSNVPPPMTVTLRQVAAYLRVGRSTIKRLVAQGLLRGSKVEGRWVFLRADVVEYVRQQTKR
jgi:excisionase family DNA binding protein